MSRNNLEQRIRLEKAVSDKFDKVKFSDTDFGWLHGTDFSEFLASWDELETYYKASDDDTVMAIGLVALNTFLITSGLLKFVAEHSQRNAERLEAEEALGTLTHSVDTIVSEAYGRTYALEDEEPAMAPAERSKYEALADDALIGLKPIVVRILADCHDKILATRERTSDGIKNPRLEAYMDEADVAISAFREWIATILSNC